MFFEGDESELNGASPHVWGSESHAAVAGLAPVPSLRQPGSWSLLRTGQRLWGGGRLSSNGNHSRPDNTMLLPFPHLKGGGQRMAKITCMAHTVGQMKFASQNEIGASTIPTLQASQGSVTYNIRHGDHFISNKHSIIRRKKHKLAFIFPIFFHGK